MKKYVLLVLGLSLFSCKDDAKFRYPKIEQQVVVNEHFGQKIEDPHRNLEDLEDLQVIKLLADQTAYTDKIISKIPKEGIVSKDTPKELISKLVVTSKDSYFYLKADTIGTNRLYHRVGFKGEEKLLFDPENFDLLKDKKYQLNYFGLNHTEDKVVVSFTKDDFEISEMIVFDILSGKIISEVITNAWPEELGGVQWLPNDTGFMYLNIPVIDKESPNYILDTETVLYKLSSKEEKKKVLFSRKNNPELELEPEDFPIIDLVSKERKYMIAGAYGVGPYADYYYASLDDTQKDVTWNTLGKKEDLISKLYIWDNDIVFLSAKDAPNFKLCKTSLNNPNVRNPEILVAEDKNAVISDFSVTKKGLFLVKTTNGVSAKLFWLKKDTLQEVKLPKAFGYVDVQSLGSRSEKLWIEARGWSSKKERYYFNYDTNTFEPEAFYPKSKNDVLNDIRIEEIEIPSHDGTMVPLSLIYNKNILKDGGNHVLITAYGAYKTVYKPMLRRYLKAWVNNGGIYAVAHVRGGGEKGDAWYKGGFKTTKPNTWKDLIAASEYLIKNKYTTKDKMAVWGVSAGGIAVGRAITERPDLFKAAAIRVGVLNTIRFESGPNGKNNTKEFGTVKDSIGFRSLLKMDAYHHIKKDEKYPAVYVTGGINDARVPAWQPAKFAIKLQENTVSKNPVLLDVDFKGGHGIDAKESKKNQEMAKIMSFLFWQTGHPDYQPKNNE